MASEMSIDDLATCTGQSVERLREWAAAGLIHTGPTYADAHVERARLLAFLARRGFCVDEIVAAERRRPGLIDDFLEQMFPAGSGPSYSLDDAAQRAGLAPEAVRRFWTAAGLTEFSDGAGDEDVEALRTLSVAIDAGLSEDAVLELVKVHADALRRVAESEVRVFHFDVHERLLSAGLSRAEVNDLTEAASARVSGLVEPVVLYFHRRGWLSAMRDDLALHVAEEAGLTDVTEVPGTLALGFVFVDLARFTSLTDTMGDAAAADVVERFSNIVRAVAASWHGRIVKQIGDEFMLVFFDQHSALGCALEIEAQTAQEPRFPAVRAAANWGPALYREGDYIGSTVNVASRLADAAGANELLVTAALREAAEELAGASVVALGPRRLKGVSAEVEVFAVRPVSSIDVGIAVDPVCGMQLPPSMVAARLDVGGEALVFCSTECLQRFVTAPDRYARAE